MTDLTPVAVVRRLTNLMDELVALQPEVAVTSERAARAESVYRREHAKARLASEERTADARAAAADLACYDLMLARKVAESAAEAVRVQSANLRTLINAGQSLLQSARTEASMAGRMP